MIGNLNMEYNIYFFDIFDTILSRSIEPEQVKRIWSRDIQAYFELPYSAEQIYIERADLERVFCEQHAREGFDLEFRYVELMGALFDRWKGHMSQKADEFAEIALQMELDIEKRVQYLCEDVVSKIRELRSMGKWVICVSDFYMPGSSIRELFRFHGIDSLIEEIYVSSDVLLTKRSSRLYENVISRLGLDKNQIIMIGDNRYSDQEMAEHAGIKGYWLNREEQHRRYAQLKRESLDICAGDRIRSLYRGTDRDQYQDMAFTLYHFTERLYHILHRKQIRDVFFLSREGEYLKKLFDLYQNVRMIDSKRRINTHYLLVSRKATLMASLKPLEEEVFETVFRQYVRISLYDFLSSLGFEKEEVEKTGSFLGIDIMHRFEDFPREEVYQKLLQCEYFKTLYERKRQVQKRNFTMYLESFGVDISDTLCLVDVGWKGTIQDNIFIFLGESKKVLGLYLGLVAPGKVADLNVKEGLIFQCIHGASKYFNVYNENKSIFEVLLGASHGSADSYQMVDGSVTVNTVQQEEEKKLFETVISPIQKGMLDMFVKIDQNLLNAYYTIGGLDKDFAAIHARMVYLPTKKQMDFFYNIYHYENFGVFEFTKFRKSQSVSIKQRIKNLKELYQKRGAFFRSSFWSVIALRNAGLSWLIRPYGYYRFLKFSKE